MTPNCSPLRHHGLDSLIITMVSLIITMDSLIISIVSLIINTVRLNLVSSHIALISSHHKFGWGRIFGHGTELNSRIRMYVKYTLCT